MDQGIIEIGEVVGAGPGSVDVRVKATAACVQCSHCSKVDRDGMLITDVANGAGAVEGDQVEVEIPPGTDIRAGMYAYIAPVAMLLFGYGAGFWIGPLMHWDRDLTGAVLGVAGVAGGMIWMRDRARKVLSSERFRPRVRAIMVRADQPREGSAPRA